DPADFRDYVAAPSVIDRVRSAERARERKAVVVHVDGDDGIAAGYFGRHQTRQAHGPDSEYGKRIPRRGLHRVEHRAGAGLPAAGEWSQQLERRVLPDLHHVAFVGDGVGGEGGLLEERAVDRGATLAHERGTVGARARAFSGPTPSCNGTACYVDNSGRCRTTETR